MVDRLKSLWPFHKGGSVGITAAHRLNVSLASEGVIYSAEPALADWPEHWSRFGSDATLVSFLAQQEELGFVDLVDQSIRLSWESLYRLLKEEPGDATELLALLHLPPLTDCRPSLASHGSLEDRDFRITLGAWASPTLGRLGTPPEFTGAVIQSTGQRWLVTEAVWHLAREVRDFYATPPNERSASGNRQAWARIRRYALDAGAPMVDFLQRTIVLTPEKLDLQMRKSEIAGARTVQVEPGFRGAPAKWLETFDKFSSIPERYDIPDGEGIIQVLIAPQVRSVLQEIRRWPGRMVAGQRAEAFIRNPFACLGEDAVAVIDETQFESARETAGIEFERFSISAERDSNGTVSGVSLLIESASSHDIRSDRYDFPDPEHLDRFINRFTSRLHQGHQCVVWEGYELEILGDAEEQLAELNELLQTWRSPSIVMAYADVFDLGRYSERIEGIGVETTYVSPFIARKSDEDGWIPENVVFGVLFSPDDGSEPVSVVLSDKDRACIQDSIHQAERQGVDEVCIPGIAVPVSVAEARQVLEILQSAKESVQSGEFDPRQRKTVAKALLLKSNINEVDYRESRKEALELPRNQEAKLPAVLKPEVLLKQHQKIGIAWLQHLWANVPGHCRGALLADDMGLGKTLQILTFVAHCLEDDPGMAPVLIVAPVSLLENWQEEIEKFFVAAAMPVLTLYGDALGDKKLSKSEIDPQLVSEGMVRFLAPDWLGNAKIVLTTYETLRDLEFSLAAQHWAIMVCDEAQKIKNPNALVTRAAKKQNVRFKIACTGTPVENSLADLWCLFDFIQPGLLAILPT